MSDLVAFVSMGLAIASATLAVAALVFGWASFRASLAMQMDAQQLLSKVTEKVELIIQQTTHQIDTAWEYFTRPRSHNSDGASGDRGDAELKSLVEQAKKELRQDLETLLRRRNLDAATSTELISQIEAAVEVRAKETESLVMKDEVVRSVNQLEKELLGLSFLTGGEVSPEIPFPELAQSLRFLLSPSAIRELLRLWSLRTAISGGDATAKPARQDILVAQDLYVYLHSLHESLSRRGRS